MLVKYVASLLSNLHPAPRAETPGSSPCISLERRVVEFLVNEADAHVNAMNHRGDTALSLAAFWGKVGLRQMRYSTTNPNPIWGRRELSCLSANSTLCRI